jgi:hypothetical protein
VKTTVCGAKLTSDGSGVLFIVLLAVISIYYISAALKYGESQSDDADLRETHPRYAIMGDMGSSGSRVYVYQYYRRLSKKAISCGLGKGGEYEGMGLVPGFEESTVSEGHKLNEKKPGMLP